MATAVTTTAPLIAIDANFLIGFCAKEPDKHPIAKSELARFAANGAQVYAPGVIISEALFVLCLKLQNGHLSISEHDIAVKSLHAIMRAVSPPPNGEASLVARAEQIRAGRTCKRITDAIYIALAEELSRLGPTELVTFDRGIRAQAASEASSVTVRLLTPASPSTPSVTSSSPTGGVQPS